MNNQNVPETPKGNSITMRSIGELIRPEDAKGVQTYRIPCYQRGYRWRKTEQVKDLLEDIKQFAETSKGREDIYCLQPIVVAPLGEDVWEVIDGQQRLTTLYMLLHVLRERRVYEIDYITRTKSTAFLQGLVCEGKTEDKHPDYYFMSEAYSFIREWFEEQVAKDVGFERRFSNILLDNVQVIWYQVELRGQNDEEREQEKIDIFNRLNIGKIQLDDAELIRALFINYTQGDSLHETTLRQGIFAAEWAEIECFLQQTAVWGFLRAEDKRTKYPLRNRILRLFELIAPEGGKGQVRGTFRSVERYLREGSPELYEGDRERSPVERATQLWLETKRLFSFLRLCYTKREYYHRVGLCLSLGLIKIEDLSRMRDQDKSSVLGELEAKLKKHFARIDANSLSYEDNTKGVKEVLLLFNVLTLDALPDCAYNRFPFDRYNQETWSLEHIHAQNSEELKEPKVIKEYITYALNALSGVEALPRPQSQAGEEGRELRSIAELKVGLRSIGEAETIDDAKRQEFWALSRELETYFSDDSSLHDLDNLALLGLGANSALSNNIFPAKRQVLLQKEREKEFIPPCTRNVFLKVYSPSGVDPFTWREADRRAYLKAMQEVLKGYITFEIPETTNHEEPA